MSALAIDSHSTLFIAFSCGVLKIYKMKKGLSNRKVTSSFELQQSLELEHLVRCLVVFQDGHKLLDECGTQILVISLIYVRSRY